MRYSLWKINNCFVDLIRLDAPEARSIPEIWIRDLFNEAKTLQHHFFGKGKRIKPDASCIVNS